MPVAHTLAIVQRRLDELRDTPEDPVSNLTSLSNGGIMELLDHVLSQCFFIWDGLLYRQTSGLPMGGRLSPILSNLFMESMEHNVLCFSEHIPRIYFRYVDNVFLVWNQLRGSHTAFLAELNAQNPDIQLTVESETDQVLPFLDVSVKRPTVLLDQERMPAEFDIYRKPTHSARYIHYDSAEPLNLKKNLVRCLWLRAHRLLSKSPLRLRTELQLLRSTFTDPKNGYPLYIINRWFNQFEGDLRRKPQLLEINTSLVFEDYFDADGQQCFILPTVQNRLIRKQSDDITDHMDSHLWPMDVRSTAITSDNAASEDGQLAIQEPERVTVDGCVPKIMPAAAIGVLREPTLISPFVPGISEPLKKIAAKYNIRSWYTYPGKPMDIFTRHRGRMHLSKCRDCVYCVICSCGCEYVGETNRNLKVCL